MTDDVAELLGQDAVVSHLWQALKAPGTRVVRLTGESGCGKSHVARQVADQWVRDGGKVVICVGDVESSYRELFPLLSGLSRTPLDLAKLLEPGARSAVMALDTVAPTPAVGTSIFDLLTSGRRQRIARLLNAYSIAERDIVLDFRRLGRRRPVLLVADNAHWWDAASLRLLRQLLSDELRDVLPELQLLVTLVVDTATEQTVVSPPVFEALVKDATATSEMHRPSAGEFRSLLTLLGLPASEMPDDLLDRLYLATGGHLKLIEQVATYGLQAGGTERFDDQYVADLLSRRFASLGMLAPEVTDVLIRACVLGLSFSENDLACITGRERPDLRSVLRQAEAIGLVSRATDSLGFSHDVIRSALLDDRSEAELSALHAKLAECLSLLRPGDYASRAHALLAAGDELASREMTALAVVASVRGGEETDTIVARLESALDDQPLLDFITVIGAGYDAVARGDFEAALPSLSTSVHDESPLMAAERHYVEAICLMGLQQTRRVSEAVQILRSWAAELDIELELRFRFELLLQQAHVLNQDFDGAREIELDLERRLVGRRNFDPTAQVLLAIQNRRSGAINTPEIAELRIEDSVAFFRDMAPDSPRAALELYRALNNLAAIRLRLGKDERAWQAALDAEVVALDAPDAVKRADVLASNVVLAGVRAGTLNIAQAIERQRFIVHSPEGADDKFIHRCNLAAYLLLAGDDEDAEIELARLETERRNGNFDESYLIFYWSALWAASAAVRGDLDEALRRHAESDGFVAALKWPTANVVKRRHELARTALKDLRVDRDRFDADRHLLDRYPGEIGVSWAYYARLFPCCELSFWSDS